LSQEFIKDLPKEELEFIKNINKILKMDIPIVESLEIYTIGIVIEKKHIIKLIISNTELQILPDSIGNLQFLVQLDLSHNALVDIPSSLYMLTRLKYLNLSGNHIESIPAKLSWIRSLESLNLSYNKLESISPFFLKLKRLNHLDISFNPINEFPDGLILLSNLDNLCIHNTKISNLPQMFLYPYIKRNIPIYAQYDIPYDEKAFLIEMNLYLKYPLMEVNQLWKTDTGFVIRDGHIVRLGIYRSDLHFLALSFNRIKHLPNSLKELDKLHTVYLNNNNLIELPWIIGELPTLNKLRLDGNRLSSLPDNISNLQNLQKIYIENNRFSTIYAIKDICLLPNLKTLSCEANFWDRFSIPVIGSGFDEIIKECKKWCEFFPTIEKKLERNEKLTSKDYTFPAFTNYLSYFEKICKKYNNEASQDLLDHIQELGIVKIDNDFSILL
jgi:Leucine Rich repeats (2 copies)